MISFIEQATGKTKSLKLGKKIGEGTYAKVFALNNHGIETNLVCKTIEIYHPRYTGILNSNYQYLPNYRLYVATNELKHLHRLGLLIGYQLKKNVFYLIMRKVNGVSLRHFSFNDHNAMNDQIFYAAFKQLKQLHRSGCVHLDAHPDNFIVSTETPGKFKISLIDYSHSQSVSWLGALCDYKTFMTHLPKPSAFLKYYLHETCEYAKNHKITVIVDLLFVTSMATLSLYKVPHLAVEPQMIRRIIQAYLMQKMAESVKFVRYMGTGPLQLFSLGLSGLVAYSDWQHGPALLMHGNNWSNPIAYVNSARLLNQLAKITETTNDFLDDYILPAGVIKQKTNLFFKCVYPTSARWYNKAKAMVFGDTPVRTNFAKLT